MDHHRPVDEVVREPQRFTGAWLLRSEVLVYERVTRRVGAEHDSLPEVLVADVRDDVIPLRLVDIGRGAGRLEADVTKRAGHPDVVGRFDLGRILNVLCQRPLLGVELLVGEQL
jgi:hypothetical protein